MQIYFLALVLLPNGILKNTLEIQIDLRSVSGKLCLLFEVKIKCCLVLGKLYITSIHAHRQNASLHY